MKGLTVLVTRPSPAGEALCAVISARGGSAIHLPTIAFAPPPDVSALQRAVDALDDLDWLIFISPQSVRASAAIIKKTWSHLPDRLQLAAVGAGTAQALAEAGWTVAACPASDWTSEGLLQLPIFQNVSGKRLAIVRGVGGRDYLAATLQARGAHVSHCVAYARTLPTLDMTPYIEQVKANKIDVIVCASFEAVDHLKKLFGKDGFHAIKQLPLVVVSERIKMLAQALDFQTIWVADNASHDAILEVVSKRMKA